MNMEEKLIILLLYSVMFSFFHQDNNKSSFDLKSHLIGLKAGLSFKAFINDTLSNRTFEVTIRDGQLRVCLYYVQISKPYS